MIGRLIRWLESWGIEGREMKQGGEGRERTVQVFQTMYSSKKG